MGDKILPIGREIIWERCVLVLAQDAIYFTPEFFKVVFLEIKLAGVEGFFGGSDSGSQPIPKCFTITFINCRRVT